ncbi:unnamed protein product [Schistosoma spindalis]|nr:unnamed protein product [Schistosoma spindale]
MFFFIFFFFFGLNKENTDDGKSNNNQSKKRVNYLCGPDGKLIVTTALAPDYDRTNHSDGYGSSGTTSNNSSKSIVVIREFESSTNSSELNGMNLTMTTNSTTPTRTTITTTTTTAITTPTTIKSIFTTNVTFSTTTLTNTINSNSVASSTTNVSYSTDNASMTHRNDQQRHENSVRLIQPNLIQGSFDSSVSEHDSTSYTYDSSSYSFSSTTAPTNSSINTASKTIDSSISDMLSVANNNSKSSLNNNNRNSNNNSNNNININNNDHTFILSPTPFNRKLNLNQQTNNHFVPSLSNTTNYNDITTSCNIPTLNGHCKNCHNIIDNNSNINNDNNNTNNNKINNNHNDKNIQSQTNGQYFSITKPFIQDNENNQNSFKKMNNKNNNNASIITNETVATMTKNAAQSNHFYSPENETTLNLYSHSNDFYSNNNNNARTDVQIKGGGKGVQMNSQEKITEFKNNNIDTNKHRNNYKHQESDNNDTLIVCISNNNRNNTSVVMTTTTPYDSNDNNNNTYVDTSNIIMRTNNSDYNSIDVSSSINSSTSSITSNNRNYYLDLDKQSNNNRQINNSSMNLKNSYDTKNAFQFTMRNSPNNNINSSITILTDPSNTTNQGSDVSIDDSIPLSTRTTATTNKTLKRFVLTRSPLSSPPVTTPTSVSPAPIHQNHHINERTPPSSAIDNTNLSITKSHFNRISLLNNPCNSSNQNYDQIDPSLSSSTSELDKISSSITFSSNPSNYTIMTRFTKQPEPQQLRQENKQLPSLIKYQQPQQRKTLNNNNNNSSVQQLSNHTDNIQSLNSTFSRINSPPSIFPRPAFWTPDVKTSRKINNVIQEDPKTKVYKWFESYEAARLLVDFGLPITGFSPNLSSLTFSRVPEWFHGFLSREQAERLLTKTDKNGSFLLHLNESFLGYVISLFTSSYCNHFLVSVIAVKQSNSGSRNTTKSTYQLYGVANPEQFTDLRDLVKFYSVHSLGRNNNQQLLLYPVGQENPTLPDYLDIFYSRPDSNSSTRL